MSPHPTGFVSAAHPKGQLLAEIVRLRSIIQDLEKQNSLLWEILSKRDTDRIEIADVKDFDHA